jgi:hypothetical protein
VAAALLVAGLALAVYLATAAPTVMWGDSGELQTVALRGGIGHPSGYPTFILLGRVFARLVPGDPAHRITVMSALFGGTAVLAFGLLLAELGLTAAGVWAGTMLWAASFTLWWSAIRCEVYTLAITCFLFGLAAALRALRGGSGREATLAACLMGLTLTTHLAFATAALLVLAMLAWRTAPGRGRGVAGWAGLALGFVAGLLPILYLAYADPRTEATNYLKYTVDLAAHQFGLTPETFHTPWQRISWIALGAEAPRAEFLRHPRQVAGNVQDLLGYTFLFDYGPLALIPLALGLRARLRRPRAADLLLAGILATSFAFGVVSVTRRMLPIFTLGYVLGVATFVAIGLDRLLARLPARALPRTLAALAAFALIAPLPHALRVQACHRPIGPRAFQVVEEGPPRIASFLPRLDRYREPREAGERCLSAIPPGSFVTGRWNATRGLVYLQQVEGRRPDLTLDSFYYPWHLERMRRWQESHDVRQRPFVAVDPIPELRACLDRADSVRISPELTLYVQRTPLRLP